MNFEEPTLDQATHVELTRPFDPRFVKWRVGAMNKNASPPSGIALAYIDARDVMKRLDSIIGPAYWQAKYPQAGMCEISIYLNGIWVTKTNCAGVTDVEAEKGQASDAFKRAAVLWGVGRYLYYLDNNWITLQPRGRSFVIPKGGEPNLPVWAMPENWEKHYVNMFLKP